MTKMKTRYTEEDVLHIFKEQHRLCSPLDIEADPSAEITGEITIQEWRWARDLVEWKDLGLFLNQEFRIHVPEQEWYKALEPAKKNTLKDVCRLIANYAEKDTYQPKTLFGQPCLKADVFLTLKRNLKGKGVDVSNLSPSSILGEYMDKYFSPVLEEITLTGTAPIDEIKTRRKKTGFWNAINIFDSDRYETLTGDLRTFRDLTEKIIEEKIKTDEIIYEQ